MSSGPDADDGADLPVAPAEPAPAPPISGLRPRPTEYPLNVWWLLVPVLAGSATLFVLDRTREAGLTLAGACFLAAALRISLPRSRAGGIAIRSVGADVSVYLTLGVLLVLSTLTLRGV
ncbi:MULTISPECIES: DUF3017 domain-containing protein [unclassified Janibacter]|uniref:DUF3017 domain-containing protein n=1 Tax=unclassified Janibacter TaxID=2649294 RepID=UPI003CFDC1B9